MAKKAVYLKRVNETDEQQKPKDYEVEDGLRLLCPYLYSHVDLLQGGKIIVSECGIVTIEDKSRRSTTPAYCRYLREKVAGDLEGMEIRGDYGTCPRPITEMHNCPLRTLADKTVPNMAK